MLSRKPVIVTPRGALKEIVKDGETGFVAKSTSPEAIAETIKRAFDGSDQIESIVDRAEKEARGKFSNARCAEETVDAFLKTAK